MPFDRGKRESGTELLPSKISTQELWCRALVLSSNAAVGGSRSRWTLLKSNIPSLAMYGRELSFKEECLAI